MSVIKTEFRVEGEDAQGNWHTIGLSPLEDDDPVAERDRVARMLRQHGIRRYGKVRLAKYVTTIDIIGEDITV